MQESAPKVRMAGRDVAASLHQTTKCRARGGYNKVRRHCPGLLTLHVGRHSVMSALLSRSYASAPTAHMREFMKLIVQCGHEENIIAEVPGSLSETYCASRSSGIHVSLLLSSKTCTAAGKVYGRAIKAAGPKAVWLDLGAHIGLRTQVHGHAPSSMHATLLRSFAVAALTGGAKHVCLGFRVKGLGFRFRNLSL